MTVIAERTVLFADLRGSTALYEQLGNAEASSVVTHTVTALAGTVAECGGQVVKTLGDGLMAVFGSSLDGVEAAGRMHGALDQLLSRGRAHGASPGLRSLRIQVALARGEVVEMGGDCFGDAVNVAARLIDHAGDNETLVTDAVLHGLPSHLRQRFRSLDWMHLRGRADPVLVYLLSNGRSDLDATTQFDPVSPTAEPDGIRLVWGDVERVYVCEQMPVILGRSPQASFCVDDSRVSRSHARIHWHGGAIQLTDLSYNGTYVRFRDDNGILSLRRSSCTLHSKGTIGLGGSPLDSTSPIVHFEVLRFGDTQTHDLDGLTLL
ncbi:adenylate/guanylate cyclase domain-containing protein [Aquincola sp. MAHUQ-54]|uniref:Adenylate/guanylate cyclase domain-containing protein n=1 Tax=Aquincola agrisoli TaxID=3119538 RepID=A0AAW9QK36_9BURK